MNLKQKSGDHVENGLWRNENGDREARQGTVVAVLVGGNECLNQGVAVKVEEMENE